MLKVFDIQRGSYHDGPGLRTVIFLKGCPLRCRWCQNPESQSWQIQLLQYKERCIGCGNCMKSCPMKCISAESGEIRINREDCTGCGACAENCYTGSLCQTGQEREINDLIEEIMEDRPFYDISGGGVTLSGGEPLAQYEGCAELLKKLKEKQINTAIETCGYVDYKAFQAVLPYLDNIYYDVKMIDSNRHKKYCGAGNEKILDNLKRLGTEGIPVIVRTPIIPGVNDTEQFIEKLGGFLSGIRGINSAELLPFHSLCTNKYIALGKRFAYAHVKSPGSSKMTTLRKKLAEYGLTVEMCGSENEICNWR